MEMFKRGVYLCAAIALTACGGQEPVAQQEPGADVATQESGLTSGTSHGCTFSVTYYTTTPPGTPPNYNVVLNRQDSATCLWGAGSVVLGSSVNYAPVLSLAANDLGVAVSYVYKTSLSGSSPSMLSLQHVDPETLAIVRSTGIAPMFGRGYVFSGNLSIEPDGTTLKVEGTKSGKVFNETGSGSNYTATYPDFFTSTTAPTIVAY
jgi:hypothetical protein